MDEMINEEVVEEVTEEPVLEEPTEEPVLEEPVVEEPVTEPVIEPVLEETAPDELSTLQAELEAMRGENQALIAQREQEQRERETQEYLRLAREQGYTDEQALAVLQEQEAQKKLATDNEGLLAENQRLVNEANVTRSMSMLNDAVAKLSKLDSSIKSIDTIPEELNPFLFRFKSETELEPVLSPEDAYFAYKAKMKSSSKQAPKLDAVASEGVEKDFYTEEEIDKMTPAEVDKNYDKVQKSMKHIFKVKG